MDQQTTPETTQPVRRATAGLRLRFSVKETARLAKLNRSTLQYWVSRGWIDLSGGASGWQVIAITILSAAVKDSHERNTYIGSVPIRRAMAELSQLDDEMLLSEDEQNMRVAEEVAAEIAKEAFTEELPPNVLTEVARVIRAIDRKAVALRARNRMRKFHEINAKRVP
jgi:hypothetical protein